MASFEDELRDASIRRAALVDRISMGEPRAGCMACRARGMAAAAILLGGGILLYLRLRPKLAAGVIELDAAALDGAA